MLYTIEIKEGTLNDKNQNKFFTRKKKKKWIKVFE